MRYVLRSLAVVGCAVGLLTVPVAADAAEFTDVLDAADDKDDYAESTYDPFDFNLEASFNYKTGTAQITREAPCVAASGPGDFDQPFDNSLVENNPRVVYDSERCKEAGAEPGGTATLDRGELMYRHRELRLDVSGRVGLYKDLELHFKAPFVLQRSRALRYTDGAGPGNSNVDPGQGRIDQEAKDKFGDANNQDKAAENLRNYRMHRFFSVTDDFSDSQYTRAGFDDPTVGLSWGAFNSERDDTKATMVLGMNYTLPVAEPKSLSNPDAVGDGLHKLEWSFNSSKSFDWVEPYFGARYMLQIPAQGTPIKELATIDDENQGQTVTNAPHIGRFTVGTEFVPYEVETEDEHRRYAIDLTFTFGYNSEGLAYTPLYDHFTNSDCNGRTFSEVLPNYSNGNYDGPGGAECSWIAQRPANVQAGSPTYNPQNIDSDTQLRTNGIMTVGPYATFTGNVGFYMQPTKYFQLKLQGGITHRREHYISNARTGSDIDNNDNEATNDDKVDLTGTDAKAERNPAYNPTYDAAGTRFRINRNNTFSVLVTAALQF